ncbi:MAG TPA: ISL3 family transposase [Ktedonobacteraceae bacterium]|nr:ISL3 family transposase [Ktedonobacteraceae bacterium]
MVSLVVLPDPMLLSLVNIEVDEIADLITAFAVTTSAEARCPLCQQASEKIRSHYTRTLADLSCFGQHVCWLVQVRRFFCRNPNCKRKIFTERLPTCAPAYARRMLRQAEILCELAFALGGKVGEQIAQLLGMTTSHDTLIRLLRRSPLPFTSTPRILGVDDFAWKKGNRYGTILVDLEKHAVIDLLPDREKKTFETWLKNHPGVEVVSRDRASAYADAARDGAPQAIQVADRFHLLVNLREHLKSFLDHKRTHLPKVEIESPDGQMRDQDNASNTSAEALPELMKPLVTEHKAEETQDTSLASFIRDTKREKWFMKPSQTILAQSQLSRARRLAQFEEVRALYQQGLSMRTIAHELRISRDLVSKCIQAESFPEQGVSSPRKARASKLDPFLPYILSRWQQGEYNGAKIYQEIREQGFTGSQPLVRLLIADLRRMHPPAPGTKRSWVRKDRQVIEDPTFGKPASSPPPKRKLLTPSQVAWLFVCRKDNLTERQQKQVEIVCQAGSDLQQVYALAQDFVLMITQQKGERFDEWLQRAEQSGFSSLEGFAKGLRKDYSAVLAALTLSWSQGQVEGQVHRLKLIKRLAYGRARFDLLRLRVLHGSGQKNHQKCV